jgi:hypothetical protein
MLEMVELFRMHLGSRPFWLTLALLVLLLLIRRATTRAMSDMWWSTVASRLLAGAALLGLVSYFAILIFYVTDPHYFDNAEPTITAVGWLFHVGQPVYHEVQAAERYAHVYGPMAFILHGFVMGVLGPSIAVSKLVGAGAAAASLVLLFVALQPQTGLYRALVLTGLSALTLLMFRNYSFWTRPEPLQLFLVSASLLVAVRGRGIVSAVLAGLCGGLLLNLKITGPLYGLPVLALLHVRAGWRHTVLASTTAAIVAVWPFMAFSNVSLASYLTWVGYSGRTGLLLSTLKQNIEWAAFFCLPLLVAYAATPLERRALGKEGRVVGLAFGVAICCVVIVAAKPGAGPYHLMPFLPVVFYLLACQLRTAGQPATTDPVVPLAAVVFGLVSIVVAGAQQTQFVTTMVERRAIGEIRDIQSFVSIHPGVVEMGYGSSEAWSLQRPVLVFRNGSYLLDQPAIREHQVAGIEIPRSTLDALRACRVNYWLIPKGEAPFEGRNAYDVVLRQPLFSDEFRRVFRETHRLTATTTYYDAWECQRRVSGQPE